MQLHWFCRRVNGSYAPTAWQILFNARDVIRRGSYTLRLALASANFAEIQVWINRHSGVGPHFSTGMTGRDNAIARHGIHGLYRLYSVSISGSQLIEGRNTIYLRQARGSLPFVGAMYDYIRLEAPQQSDSSAVSYTNMNMINACTSILIMCVTWWIWYTVVINLVQIGIGRWTSRNRQQCFILLLFSHTRICFIFTCYLLVNIRLAWPEEFFYLRFDCRYIRHNLLSVWNCILLFYFIFQFQYVFYIKK